MQNLMTFWIFAKPLLLQYGPFVLGFAAGHVSNPTVKSILGSLGDILKKQQPPPTPPQA